VHDVIAGRRVLDVTTVDVHGLCELLAPGTRAQLHLHQFQVGLGHYAAHEILEC